MLSERRVGRTACLSPEPMNLIPTAEGASRPRYVRIRKPGWLYYGVLGNSESHEVGAVLPLQDGRIDSVSLLPESGIS